MGSITLTWNDTNTTETGHKVYRSLTPMTVGSLPAPIATIGANITSYMDDTVIAGETYYYRVAAVRNLSEAVSAEISVAAIAGALLVAPSGLVLELIEGTVGHKFWRVFVTKTRTVGAVSTQISEVEFHDTIGGVNKATLGTATALSEYATGNGAELAFDGSVTSAWAAQSLALPQWIMYEFIEQVGVAEVMLQSGDDSGRASRAPEDFAIEYSDDGITWTQQAAFVGEPAWGISEIRTYSLAAPVEAPAETPPTTIGQASNGGYYIGDITVADGGADDGTYAVIMAGVEAETLLAWKTVNTETAGTESQTNGFANTLAMQTYDPAAHEAGMYCLDYVQGEYDDWYFPSVNELGLVGTSRELLVALNIGATNDYYHSSSQTVAAKYSAWRYNFYYNVAESSYAKDISRPIRPVRRIKKS